MEHGTGMVFVTVFPIRTLLDTLKDRIHLIAGVVYKLPGIEMSGAFRRTFDLPKTTTIIH